MPTQGSSGTTVVPRSFLPGNQVRTCPECDGPLDRASGCVTCRQCGWGRCG